MINIKLPVEVKEIINRLEEAGHEAYIVGGCVRDSLLGMEASDFDITTSAEPEEVKKVIKKTVDTGIKHGTVTAFLNGKSFEITTYRIDGKYEDSRRPNNVSFTKSLEEDLKRRDFTINAMAYNEKVGLCDLFGGQKDLENKVIRCVGKASERFFEDGLRMLRALRFSAKLGFEIDYEAKNAIRENSYLIKNISAERIREELTKILISKSPGKIFELQDLNLMEHIIPEAIPMVGCVQNSPWHIYDVATHTIKTMENIENTSLFRWSMFLHDIGKPAAKTTDSKGFDHFRGHPELGYEMAKKILRRLKFDNKSMKDITTIVKYHDCMISPREKRVRKVASWLGTEMFEKLLKVKMADDLAKNPEKIEKQIEEIKYIEKLYEKILNENQCISVAQLAITGSDLIEMGYEEGAIIGKTLNALLDVVLDKPEYNKRDTLLEIAARRHKKIYLD